MKKVFLYLNPQAKISPLKFGGLKIILYLSYAKERFRAGWVYLLEKIV